MSLLGSVARAAVARRIMQGGSGRRGRSSSRYGIGRSPMRYGSGRSPARYGRGRGQQGGFGMFGPFPTYSRRTRGGSSVSVGGCCLPIPLALTVGSGLLARRAVRR